MAQGPKEVVSGRLCLAVGLFLIVFGATVKAQTRRPAPAKTNPGKVSAYYITTFGIDYVNVRDAFGNSNVILDDLFALAVPEVSYQLIGEKAILVILPIGRTYTLKFRRGTDPVAIEIIKGVGIERPDEVIRYNDLALPEGVTAMLRTTSRGIGELRYDRDGDGKFESMASPTAKARGALARDIRPPQISFSEEAQGPYAVISINARDNFAGVLAVYYSSDGEQFQVYKVPVKLDPGKTPVLYVFADDKVGNRTETLSYKLLTRHR